jgi:hypothetical protein
LRTAIEIANCLLRKAKATAARKGTTVRALVAEGLRRVRAARGPRARFRLRYASFRRGKGLQAGVSEGSWARIRRFVYEGRGG